jgi:hypothetical protein
MTTYPEVVKRATGEYLRAGTINVDVGQRIEIREEFIGFDRFRSRPERAATEMTFSK